LLDAGFVFTKVALVHAVGKEDPVKVIDLVKDTAPEQAIRLDDVWLALEVLKGATHTCGAGDAPIHGGKGKTALLVDLGRGR
jgi:hypothetical protein